MYIRLTAVTQVMEERKMEHEMEAGILSWFIGIWALMIPVAVANTKNKNNSGKRPKKNSKPYKPLVHPSCMSIFHVIPI